MKAPIGGRRLVSKTPKTGSHQGRLLNGSEVSDEYRRPLMRAYYHGQRSLLRPCGSEHRFCASRSPVCLASRTGHHGRLAESLCELRPDGVRVSGLDLRGHAVYSRAGVPKKHHYRKDHRYGRKGEAMAFRCTVVACKQERTEPTVRPGRGTGEGKKA